MSGLSKLDALLHKTHNKVLLVLQDQGSIHNIIKQNNTSNVVQLPIQPTKLGNKKSSGCGGLYKIGGRNPLPTICIDAAQQCSSSDVPKRIFIPVYWYGCPNYGTQKKKYTFIYSDIFCPSLYFFLLNRIKVCFQVRKHTLSIVNHPKA